MGWKEDLAKLFLYDTDKGKTKPDGSPATEEGEGNYVLDPAKIAGLLGFGLSASGAFQPKDPPVGYQGVVPKYDFVRKPVQGTYQDYRYVDGGKRRPGSGGQRYFTDPQFVQKTDRMTGEALGTYADDLAAAEEVATTQAEDLQEFNRRNPAHDWEGSGWGLGGVNMGDNKSTLPTIPTPDSQLAGAINLGMANGGIVGLKNGTPPNNDMDSFLNKDSWDLGAIKEIMPNISEGIAGLKKKVVGLPGELKDLGKGVYEDVTNWRDAFNPAPNFLTPNHVSSEMDTPKKAEAYVREAGGDPDYTGHGNILSLDDWKKSFTAPSDVGNQFIRNAIQDYKTAENLRTYNVDSEGDSLGTYSDAEKSRRRGERRAEEEAARMADWRGQDYANFSQEAAQDYLNKMAGTTRGSTGDYSDLDTFQDYRFSDPNFQYDDFRKIAEIAGYGAEDQLSAGKNISSGAGPDAYRQSTPDTFEGLVNNTNLATPITNFTTTSGLDYSPATIRNEILPITTHYTNLTGQEKTDFYDLVSSGGVTEAITDPETGEVTSQEIPQNKLNAYKQWLDYINSLAPEELEQARLALVSLRDFTGVTGQGAAYGGAIEGYSIGGLGEAPQGLSSAPGLPAGLLKSPEDGMADTIPAQMGNQPINLSGGEYIVDAESVAFLGNGNTDAGARKLDDFRENLRMAKNGGDDQGNQINSENFLNRLQQMGVA